MPEPRFGPGFPDWHPASPLRGCFPGERRDAALGKLPARVYAHARSSLGEQAFSAVEWRTFRLVVNGRRLSTADYTLSMQEFCILNEDEDSDYSWPETTDHES